MSMTKEQVKMMLVWNGDPNATVGRVREACELIDSLASAPQQPEDRRLADAERELAEMQQTFDLMWGADQRAIVRWQAAHPGNDLVWPDREKLVTWLLDELDRKPGKFHEPSDAAAGSDKYDDPALDNLAQRIEKAYYGGFAAAGSEANAEALGGRAADGLANASPQDSQPSASAEPFTDLPPYSWKDYRDAKVEKGDWSPPQPSEAKATYRVVSLGNGELWYVVEHINGIDGYHAQFSTEQRAREYAEAMERGVLKVIVERDHFKAERDQLREQLAAANKLLDHFDSTRTET